jgi:FKBP-type peptidyl-prolyl cis-trans isomerase SlyD
MQIQDQALVEIEYTLTLDNGEVVDRTEQGETLPFIFNAGQVVPGLEEALEGKEVGFQTKLTLEPEKAYGDSDPELVTEIPRENFPDELELESGMSFEGTTDEGPVAFHITELKEDCVVADFNHPLAGERLHFDLRVATVRQATAEDIERLSCDDGCDCEGDCEGDCA